MSSRTGDLVKKRAKSPKGFAMSLMFPDKFALQIMNEQSYLAHVRGTLRLSFPVVIGQVGHVLMGVIDSLMIGQLGYAFLSAASLANGIFFLLTILGIGATFAVSPLVAEAEAAHKPQRCAQYLQQGIWVALGFSLLICLLVQGCIWLLPFMNQPPDDVRLGSSYLTILNASVLPMMMFMLFKQFADGLSFTVPAMVITLLGLGVNTLANWMLIYGNGGAPRLELDGAGYGTLLSRVFMMLLMVGYVWRSRRFYSYGLFRTWLGWAPHIVRKILAIGVPSGLQYFFEVGAFSAAVILAGLIGAPERAAHQIVIQLASISYMVVSGIAAGAAIRVGAALGRKGLADVRRAGVAGMGLSAGFMLLMALTFVVGRKFLPDLFVDDAYVLNVSAHLMIIAAIFQLVDGIQAVALGVLRGIQDVLIPTIITLVAYWGILIPLGVVLAFLLDQGIYGLWHAFVIGLGVAAGLLGWRFFFLTRTSSPVMPARTKPS